MAVTGNIVAEHDDDIGAERIGALHNGLDVIQRHPGIAGMKIGDRGDLELETGGPLRRGNAVARDAKPQHGLDAETIAGGRNTGGAEAGYEAQKLAAGNQEWPIGK